MSLPPPKLACAHLLDLRDGRTSLVGSRCCRCDEVYFPATAGCTRCLSTDLQPFDIGSEGTLWSWTIQDFLPKAPYNSGETEADFEPYGVGYVEMPSGIKIESRLTVADPGRLQIGMPMRLALAKYGHTMHGEPIFTFVFSPLQAATEGANHG